MQFDLAAKSHCTHTLSLSRSVLHTYAAVHIYCSYKQQPARQIYRNMRKSTSAATNLRQMILKNKKTTPFCIFGVRAFILCIFCFSYIFFLFYVQSIFLHLFHILSFRDNFGVFVSHCWCEKLVPIYNYLLFTKLLTIQHEYPVCCQ